MKRISMAIAAGVLMLAAGAGTATAQQPGQDPGPPPMSLGELTPTPSMWFYQQYMNTYLDPHMAVRRAAEKRAAERDGRIASRKWFGYSNARPMAIHTPFTNWHSPTWAGNGLDRWHWWGVGRAHYQVVDRSNDYVIR